MLSYRVQQFMSHQQKKFRLRSQYDQPPPTEPEPSRERQLVLRWEQQQVNDSYQSIVLNYLDTLTAREVSTQVQRELQRLHNKCSYYHKIEYLVLERERTLDLLYDCVQEINVCIQGRSSWVDLQKTCDLIDHVRKTSMLVSEAVWEMFEHFQFKPAHKSHLALGTYYLRLSQHFDDDLQFLRQSAIRYYICFSQNFDPLLLEAAKPLKRFYLQNKIVYNEHVDELFRINASYLYRLLRAHQRILSNYLLSKDLNANQQKQELELDQYSRPNSNPAQQKRTNSITASQADNRKSSQPDKKKVMKRERFISQEFQASVPSRQSKGEVELGKRGLQARKGKNASKDNLRITRIGEITINYSKQSGKGKSRSRSVNKQEGESGDQNELPKNLMAGSQSRNPHHSSLSGNKGTITQSIELKKSKPSSQNEFIPEGSPYSERTSNQDQKKMSPHKGGKMSRVVDDKSIKRKHSRSLQLPRLEQEDHSSHDKSSDCLCRQKYKSRKLKQSYLNIPAEDVQEKRQTIIKKINQKYKQLAKKEIRYELSLLGDVTYHRMREKVLHSRIKQRHPNNPRDHHNNRTPLQH